MITLYHDPLGVIATPYCFADTSTKRSVLTWSNTVSEAYDEYIKFSEILPKHSIFLPNRYITISTPAETIEDFRQFNIELFI